MSLILAAVLVFGSFTTLSKAEFCQPPIGLSPNSTYLFPNKFQIYTYIEVQGRRKCRLLYANDRVMEKYMPFMSGQSYENNLQELNPRLVMWSPLIWCDLITDSHQQYKNFSFGSKWSLVLAKEMGDGVFKIRNMDTNQLLTIKGENRDEYPEHYVWDDARFLFTENDKTVKYKNRAYCWRVCAVPTLFVGGKSMSVQLPVLKCESDTVHLIRNCATDEDLFIK
jgi:hypothetical protein